MNLSLKTGIPQTLLLTVGLSAPAMAQGLTEFVNGEVANANAINANFNAVNVKAGQAQTAAAAAQGAADSAATNAAAAQAAADAAAATASSAQSAANAASNAVTPLTNVLTINSGNVGVTSTNATFYTESTANIFARGNKPRFGQGSTNNSWNLNSADGVMIESGTSESGGFFANGNTAAIWSPGDSNLLNIYDEDDLSQPSPTPDAFLNGAGAWTAQAFNTPSDRNFKTNIRPLGSSLSRVMKISGFAYDYRPETRFSGEMASGKPYDPSPIQNQIGFIAQELQKTMPELVQYSDTLKGLTVNYDGMIPVLVEAMKEQQAQIEALKAELEALKKGK